jgi:mRNA interferase RelE/StbE
MTYSIELKPRAVKDLDAFDRTTARRILVKIRGLETDLAGDVKRLTDFTPEYRLRVGDYRVLFEVEGDRVIIYRVKHRSRAYS